MTAAVSCYTISGKGGHTSSQTNSLSLTKWTGCHKTIVHMPASYSLAFHTDLWSLHVHYCDGHTHFLIPIHSRALLAAVLSQLAAAHFSHFRFRSALHCCIYTLPLLLSISNSHSSHAIPMLKAAVKLAKVKLHGMATMYVM